MKKLSRTLSMALFSALMMSMGAAIADDAKTIKEGKVIAFDKKKGNCIA